MKWCCKKIAILIKTPT